MKFDGFFFTLKKNVIYETKLILALKKNMKFEIFVLIRIFMKNEFLI